MKTTSKNVSESSIESTYMVMPEHTNPMGHVFGGTVMSWIDMTAAIVAFRHCRTEVVTASMDEVHFLYPVKLGHLVTLKAAVNYSSKRSIEIGVKVIAEDPIIAHSRHTASAYLTFVSLDKKGKAILVPQIVPLTKDEKIRFKAGEVRYLERKAKRG